MYQKLFSANEHTYYVNYAYFYMYNMYTVYIISPPNVVESKYNMDIQQLSPSTSKMHEYSMCGMLHNDFHLVIQPCCLMTNKWPC